jgi:uncharacterized membrane protein
MIVAHTLVIKRSIEDVFAAATDLPLSAAWRSGLRRVTQTSQGALGVGATFDEEVQIMSMTRTNAAVVTEYRPPYCFGYKLVSDLAYHFTRFTLEPDGPSTRFTVTIEGEALPAWLKLMRESMMLRWMQSTIAQEIEVFKALIENGADRVALPAT